MSAELSNIQLVEQIERMNIASIDAPNGIDTDCSNVPANTGSEGNANHELDATNPTFLDSVQNHVTIPIKLLAADQSDASLPGTTFTLFPKLPAELRIKIWGFAADPRVIYATEVVKETQTSATEVGMAGSEWVIKYKTNLFDNCGELYEVCKEIKQGIHAMGYRRRFQLCGSKATFYFHPQIDRLEIHSDLLQLRLPPQSDLCFALESPMDLTMVRHLSISLFTFEYNYKWIMDTMAMMASLEDIKLIGHIPTFSSSPKFNLRMTFEDLEGEGDKMTPVFKSGDHYVISNEAMKAIFEMVKDSAEQQRLSDLWDVVDDSFRFSPSFPSVVIAEINYIPE